MNELFGSGETNLIDRRYSKEGNFNIVFTSNKNPALWREDFEEDATLLCTLNRIFDDATVFGSVNSFRVVSIVGPVDKIKIWTGEKVSSPYFWS